MSSLSGFLGQTPIIKPSLGIDRLTLLFLTPSLCLFGDDAEMNRERYNRFKILFEKNLADNLDDDFPQGVKSDLFLSHYRTTSGVDVQFGSFLPVRKKSLMGDDSFVYDSNLYSFRIEYNPNKTGLSELKNVLQNFPRSVLNSVKVSRIDLCFDYASDIDPALVWFDRTRKSFLAIGKTGIETVYFGSRSSKIFLRVYNKRVELEEKEGTILDHPLWRVEFEFKDSFSLFSGYDFGEILKRFSFYGSGVSLSDWKLRLLILHAKDYGIKSALQIMPESSRKRYKILFDEFFSSTSLETPFDCYERDFSRVFNSLRSSILTCFGVSNEKNCSFYS